MPTIQLVPSTLVALVALGMSFAFISADPRSPTSRALGVALGAMGIAIGVGVPLMASPEPLPWYARWIAIADTVSMIAFLEWILRVRHTVPAGDFDVRAGDALLRVGQGAAVLYFLLALLVPGMRFHDFLGALYSVEALARPGFWLFATPVLAAMLSGAFASLLLLARRPDKPEKLRVMAMMLATPFLTMGLVLPTQYGMVAVVFGELVFLVGAVHYHVMQGQRGQFMSRFLSPQVAELVRVRGLKFAMQEKYLEVTVVVIDLRDFTAYAQAHPSSRVIQVLREYYRVVGRIVAEYGATIKDLAGDGILILAGAPLPAPDHAPRALQMAAKLRETVQPLTRRWSTGGLPLGVGLGVASGMVTVGAIGAGERYEYTAVGPAVNLASRLCEQAGDGEILVARSTIELCQSCPEMHAMKALEARAPIQVKGFAEPVEHFNLEKAPALLAAPPK